MNTFVELNYTEQVSTEGGGFLAAIAGGLAGFMIGSLIGAGTAIITGEEKNLVQGATAGASLGFWLGAGAPTP